ncbi:uncharacterized protein jus isoform X1 [Plodia interpunctella]|uniref:uncharacterized protein jus isoform X1 n=1 Tax=Plodia interpunctella TaxID=58824 RepID=UPI0023685E6C|nr:uncharacterized protein LOC128671560 isoform X1 [Plodia interpunctella]
MRGERFPRCAASLAALIAFALLPLCLASTSKGGYYDPCSTTADCNFTDSVCDQRQKLCVCHPDVPISNHVDKCGKPASINETCAFNEQCEDVDFKTECRNEKCVCKFEMVPEMNADGVVVCTPEKEPDISTKTIDPAMIGVLVGMALMFVIICVVLRLFSRARWRENRTIFNTPNPRLMNVSLLRDSKLLHTQHFQDRRGSRVSMRPPSRQASQQELRPHSPSPARHHQSHQLHRKSSGSRRGSRASSGHSATSLRSATLRSPTAPGPTSVTVEIRAPDA